MSEDPRESFVTAGHAVLFEDQDADCCDVCGSSIDAVSESQREDFCVSGKGLYVWTRGDERRADEPPLCAKCAVAIGLSALSRWEIEEDEG